MENEVINYTANDITTLSLVKKYAPQVLDDMVGLDDVKSVLKAKIEKNNLGHLLLHGKQGSGKTTTVFCLRNQLFGNDVLHHFFEINASANNGVDFIRDEVTRFATMAVPPLADGRFVKRIIFLDECDALSSSAQAVLRRLMEDCEASVSFILACNYVHKIIPALRSRCQEFEFKGISDDLMVKYLDWVCKEETRPVPIEQLNVIAHAAHGDIRKALNYTEQVMDGALVTELTETILSKKLQELLDMSYKYDCEVLFEKLHEEVVALARTGKYPRIADVIVSLAESEYHAAMSRDKIIQFQAAVIKIKKLFA